MPETRSGKKKLLIILGAGSSVELGMPSVGELDRSMRQWAREQADEKKSPDFFGLLWEIRRLYAAEIPADDQRGTEYSQPNYERCLGDMVSLLNAFLPPPVADPLQHSLLSTDRFEKLGLPSERSNTAIREQFTFLVRRLAALFRGRCWNLSARISPNSASFSPYCDFFRELAQRFELGIYNLNHDTVALEAVQPPEQSKAPKFFTGFSDCHFDPAAVHQRAEWRFIYHLHGSVHQCFPENTDHTTQQDLFSKAPTIWMEDLANREVVPDLPKQGNDGKLVPVTSLVAGGWKLGQLQVEPFQTFYSTLPRHAHEADAILIGGYSFGDPHVNSILANVLRARERTRPRVMVVDYWDKRKIDAGDPRDAIPQGERVLWCSNLGEALRIDLGPTSFVRAAGRGTATTPDEAIAPLTQAEFCVGLKTGHPLTLPAEEFAVPLETADGHRYPLAVWFGGFEAATKQAAVIVKWLAGKPSGDATPGRH